MNSPKPPTDEVTPPGIVFWMQGATASEGAAMLQLLDDCATTGATGMRVCQADDAEALQRLADERGTDRILMLVQSPVQALARAMERGEAPSDTLHDWLEGAQIVRTVLRRHRRRSIVADAARFSEDPAEVLAALGLPDSAAGTDRATPAEPADPVLELIAAEVLREVPGIRALVGELDASASVTGPDVDPADVDVILNRYRATLDRTRKLQAELTQVRRQAEESRSEQDAVLRQLLQAQETAEERRQANERLTGQLHQLRAGLDSSEKRLDELQTERDSKTEQLKTIETALEEKSARLKAVEAERDEKVAALEMLQERHDRESRAQAEALESTQAALVEKARALEEGAAEAARLKADLEARFSEIGGLTQRLEKVQTALTERDTELAGVKAEIAGIKASRSYRWTSPLRWLRAAMKRKG